MKKTAFLLLGTIGCAAPDNRPVDYVPTGCMTAACSAGQARCVEMEGIPDLTRSSDDDAANMGAELQALRKQQIDDGLVCLGHRHKM